MLTSNKSLAKLKNYDEAVARWVSRIISPHIVGIVITSAMAFYFGEHPWEILVWLALLIPLLVLPPLCYIIWLVHRGTLEDIFMPKRENRLRPLAVSILWLIFCLGLIRYWSAPAVVEAFVITAIVLMGILSFVTLFWKISFHGATISAAATATLILMGFYAWPIVLLVPLVGWARVRLDRHTPLQVIWGSVVGVLIALIMMHGILLRL